jgi:hypothetical protein
MRNKTHKMNNKVPNENYNSIKRFVTFNEANIT